MRLFETKTGLISLIGVLAATSMACSGSNSDDDIDAPRDGGTTSARDAGVDGGAGSDRDAGPAPRDGGTVPFDSGCLIEDNVDLTPDPACAAPGVWTVKVTGSVEDPEGNPADGALVNICLSDERSQQGACLPPRPVCADGRYQVLIPEPYRCTIDAVARAFAQSGGTAFTYCDIETSDVELTVTEPVALFRTTPATTLPPEGDETMSRTVVFADGLEMDVVPEDFPAPYEELAATRVPQAEVCTLAGGPAYDGIYALSPETDLPGLTFPIRIPNTTNLAAGTTVRTYVLGGLLCSVERPGMDEYLVSESEWYEFGTAQVSADGTMIEGAALPCVGWFAYRQ